MEQQNGILGILGGMGPQATEILYQWVIDRTDAGSDQEHIPTLIWSDTQIPDRTEAILSGRADTLLKRMLADIKLLSDGGVSCIAIPCNTSHYFYEDLQASTDVPILHMPRLTLQKIAESGKRKAALLATDGTVQSGIYHKEAKEAGLEIWNPPESIQRQVMSLIYDEIKRGGFGTPQMFIPIAQAVREAGCDCAILACTELSVYHQYHNLSDYFVDAMSVLADACVDFFGKKKME